MHCRAALVGPMGHGKSTLLDELVEVLRSEWSEVIRVKLKWRERKLPAEFVQKIRQASQSRHLFVIDGAEQLSRWRWLRYKSLLQRHHGCLITSHRAGLLPTLRNCQTSPALLVSLVQELAGPLSEKQSADLNRLYQVHRGDLRGCFRALYDAWAAGIWQEQGSARPADCLKGLEN